MQSKIRKVSVFFRIVFQIAFIIIPVVHIIAWIFAPAALSMFSIDTAFVIRAIEQSTKILHPLGLSTKMLGLLVSGIPVIVVEYIFYFLIKLFRLYEKGEIFSLPNVNYIKKTGYALFILQLVEPICEGLLTGIVTWHNPPGYRYVTISLSGIDVVWLLMAFLIILISWIMAEGCRLREEQQLTI